MRWNLGLLVLGLAAGTQPILGPRARNAATLVDRRKLPLHTRGGSGCLMDVFRVDTSSNGLEPNGKRKQIEMASNLVAMASNLIAIASNLLEKRATVLSGATSNVGALYLQALWTSQPH